MADDDTDTIDGHDHDHDHSPPAADPVLIALTLCRIANNKTLERAIKKRVKLDEQYAVAEEKFVNLQNQAAAMQTALTARAAALDARAAAITKREEEFASSLEDARRELYAHHNAVEQAHRQLVYRIMSTAGIAGNWNFDLQDPPTWQQLRRMIADLPDDLPAAPPAEAAAREVTTDWTGQHNFISGSTLTRSVPQ
jgi:hypothetical protein